MTRDRLREEIDIELENLTRCVNAVEELQRIATTREVTMYERAGAALILSQYYNGIENILKRICRASKSKMPTGENSHVELFELFVEERGAGFPVLFPPSIRQGYIELRRFRHYVHHGYAFQLEWERLTKGISTLRALFDEFRNRVENFLNEESLPQ